ncbi:sulfite exporter TauE/SafE family protein [Granulosicoccaceae sp. 1_MG-2023]|nr:sulfite exporter TauE/SafE family protein [Granulosicoccaceae sp. 1_MG-2023]
MTTLLFLGFLLGMRHAMEADHVAAVATLVRDNHSLRDSLRHGAVWGLGHTITLLLVGAVVIIFGGSLTESIAHWLEFAVGVVLLLLGIDVIRRVYKERVHFHLHHHGPHEAHFHAHSHANDRRHDAAAHQHTHSKQALPLRTLVIGLMHGLAGASALIILTINAISSPWMAISYILIFGLGSMLGMALLSVVIAWPLRRSASGMTRLHSGVHYALGVFTAALGVKVMLANLPAASL